jgi:hypothetical protein
MDHRPVSLVTRRRSPAGGATTTQGKTVIINDLPFLIDRDMLLKLTGYSDKRPAPPRLVAAADRVIERAHALAHPRAVYEVHETALDDDGAVVLAGGRFTGKIIARVLKGSDLATAYALTLGPELDAEASALAANGDVLSSILLDTAGSLVVAKASIALIGRIFDAEAAPRGWSVTPPFGPGQCRWDLAEQRVLFDLIAPSRIGIALTDTFLMIPKKSVSGVLGIGMPDEIFTTTPCRLCDRKDCPGRSMFEIMGESQ